MESTNSKLILSLQDIVKDILLAEPIDVIENDERSIYECSEWELVTTRPDGTTKIGSANLIVAHNAVIQALHKADDKSAVITARVVFQTVLALLESHRVIRQPPHKKRKGFKVIHNDR